MMQYMVTVSCLAVMTADINSQHECFYFEVGNGFCIARTLGRKGQLCGVTFAPGWWKIAVTPRLARFGVSVPPDVCVYIYIYIYIYTCIHTRTHTVVCGSMWCVGKQ